MVTIWWFAACLINYSCLNPSKTITSEKYAQQINEIHWKLQGLQLILVNRIGLVLFHNNALQPMLQKLNELGYDVFVSSTIFTWPLTNLLQRLQASTTFCRENVSTTIRMQKMLSRSSWNLKAQISMLKE